MLAKAKKIEGGNNTWARWVQRAGCDEGELREWEHQGMHAEANKGGWVDHSRLHGSSWIPAACSQAIMVLPRLGPKACGLQPISLATSWQLTLPCKLPRLCPNCGL